MTVQGSLAAKGLVVSCAAASTSQIIFPRLNVAEDWWAGGA